MNGYFYLDGKVTSQRQATYNGINIYLTPFFNNINSKVMSSYCLNEPFFKERWDSPTRTTKEHHCDATKKSQFNRKNLNMDELGPLCSNLFNVPPKTKVPTVASKLVR